MRSKISFFARLKNNAEPLKTLLIILLLISAVFLGAETALFDDFFGSVGLFDGIGSSGDGQGMSGPSAAIAAEAARPLSIVVTSEDGAHYGTRYTPEVRDSIYERTSAVFTELFGAETEPSPVTEDAWRAALSTQSVYYEYAQPVELSILAEWFGARLMWSIGGNSVSRLCVVPDETSSTLFFEDADGGSFHSVTASTIGAHASLSLSYEPNGVCFAFENAAADGLVEPYMLLFPETAYAVITAVNPFESGTARSDILGVFGINPSLNSGYTGTDGATWYVDEAFMVSVADSGEIEYQLTNRNTTANTSATKAYAIEQARKLLSEVYSNVAGSAELSLHSVEEEAGGGYLVSFSYYIGGGLVHVGDDGLAASVTVRNGIVTKMQMSVREYSFTGGYVSLLPELQAAAVSGGGLTLCYYDYHTGEISPAWIKR